ncbi:hypothetical protein CH273_25725 [Rhodococcus sp. 05-339-2]|uniref:hypothetical protein n=1 Tax=Rhodococcoides fascians TaxID=1828 RepID=UPI00050C85BC|nr:MULTISPECIES: hypothetical protein [Rhodococcus]OZD74889.1 hypothetical protein CH273_25725 [Rhodococcus sp. 05-339-2]
MARLAVFVHVADKNGDIHAFGPDDDVPAWAVKSITNPGVWAEAPEPAKAPASPRKTAAKPAVAKTVTPETPKTEAPAGDGGQAPKPAPGEAFAAETGNTGGADDAGAGDDSEE